MLSRICFARKKNYSPIMSLCSEDPGRVAFTVWSSLRQWPSTEWCSTGFRCESLAGPMFAMLTFTPSCRYLCRLWVKMHTFNAWNGARPAHEQQYRAREAAVYEALRSLLRLRAQSSTRMLDFGRPRPGSLSRFLGKWQPLMSYWSFCRNCGRFQGPFEFRPRHGRIDLYDRH